MNFLSAGVFCALAGRTTTIHLIADNRSQIAAQVRQEWRKKMQDNKKQTPVYLWIYFGKKGNRTMYAHSLKALEDAGYTYLASWKSLAGPIRYRDAK